MNVSSNKGNKGLLLLVDDNAGQRDALVAAFTAAGFVCHSATNAASALNLMTESNYDLAIVAYQMKPVNGVETATYLRDLKSFDKMPIIMITDVVDNGLAKEAMISGIDRIMPREDNRNRIIKAVHELLRIPYRES